MKLLVASAMALACMLSSTPVSDPYGSLTPGERTLLKFQIERWIRDQTKHDWTDMWEIQDQTPDLKNEILLGQKGAPDLDRIQYVQAMRATIGIGFPEIKAYTLREIRRENGGFWILGCGKLQREEWKQTSMTDVHVKVVNGKAMFGLPGGTPEPCKL